MLFAYRLEWFIILVSSYSNGMVNTNLSPDLQQQKMLSSRFKNWFFANTFFLKKTTDFPECRFEKLKNAIFPKITKIFAKRFLTLKVIFPINLRSSWGIFTAQLYQRETVGWRLGVWKYLLFLYKSETIEPLQSIAYIIVFSSSIKCAHITNCPVYHLGNINSGFLFVHWQARVMIFFQFYSHSLKLRSIELIHRDESKNDLVKKRTVFVFVWHPGWTGWKWEFIAHRARTARTTFLECKPIKHETLALE